MKPFEKSAAEAPAGGGLRRLAVRGAGVTVLSQGGVLLVQMVATVVLARILAPRDFGVVTMVTTFSLLVSNFGLNGFTEAVIQRGEIDRYLASNLFWICLGAGLLLTLGFAALGPLLAWFYHDPLVARVTVGVSLTILFTSTSVLHLALLKRAMRFSVVSANDIVARAVSVAVSILLAIFGWGYWALVVGVVALPVSQTVGAWGVCRWTPSLPRRVEGTWGMVEFASHVYGRFTVNYFARNLDNVLVGWRFNAQALGFYKKAYDLFALSAGQLTSPLTTVAVAALSRLNRDPAQYRRYFLNALGVTAFVGMGVGGDLTLVGKDVIRALLGPQWGEAGRIFTFFGPGIGMMLLYGTHGWIHLSIGRADRWFRWGIFEFVSTAGLFVLGLHWGPVGIAVAWTVSFWVLCFPALWYAGRPINLSLVPILADTGKYIVASFAAALGCLAFFHVVPLLAESPRGPGAVGRMVVTSLAFAILYLAAVIGLHRGTAPLTQVAGLLREMLPARLPKLTQEVISTP